MAWNDGISKEIGEYFEKIEANIDQAVDAIKEQVDIEAEDFRKEMELTAPRGATLGLLNSLRKTKIIKKRNWYGYSVEFEGYNKKGEPYQKIANILNYGTSSIQGTRFISRAIRKLKGMDERIARKFETKITK